MNYEKKNMIRLCMCFFFFWNWWVILFSVFSISLYVNKILNNNETSLSILEKQLNVDRTNYLIFILINKKTSLKYSGKSCNVWMNDKLLCEVSRSTPTCVLTQAYHAKISLLLDMNVFWFGELWEAKCSKTC